MVNFKNVQTTSFSSLPEDWYELKAAEVKIQTSQKGNKKINVQFEVLDPNFKKRKIWTDFILIPSSLWFLKLFLEKAGHTDLIEKEDVSEDEIVQAIKGSIVKAYLEPSVTPSGKQTNVVRNWETSDMKTQTTAAQKPQNTITNNPIFQ